MEPSARRGGKPSQRTAAAQDKGNARNKVPGGTAIVPPVATTRSSPLVKKNPVRQRQKAHVPLPAKLNSLFKDTRLLVKKSVRNLIFYPAAILCLYPLLIFKSKILIVLYLYLWTNIVIAIATFLDELFDLPRKR